MSSFKTIEWKNNKVIMIDQRKLPTKEVYVECESYEEVAECIKNMVIRGAPAIGVAASMGIAIGALKIETEDKNAFLQSLEKIYSTIWNTRPTAVNLFWAIEKMKTIVEKNIDFSIDKIKNILIESAIEICKKDVESCKRIGKFGSGLIKNNSVILTHCNAGGLATAGYGTALGVIRAAFEEGKQISVISSETRPFLQGSRLTAWELKKDNIPVKLITDNMAGYLMSNNMIDCIVVGADRIASNGDVANKIGTYSLSVLAKHHGIPFYVAAPVSTIDFKCSSGKDIPIEERNPNEVTHIFNKRVAAEVDVFNPAFDITPNENVNSIITDVGLFQPNYKESLSLINNIN